MLSAGECFRCSALPLRIFRFGMVWIARLKQLLPPVAAAAIAVGAVLVGGAGGLALLVVAAGVAGASFAGARRSCDSAEARVREAASRELESSVIAEAATALLAAPTKGEAVSPGVERALAEVGVRLQMCHAPSPQSGEVALPLRAGGGSGWLYVDRDGPLSRAEAERLQARLADLISAAHERTRIATTAADAEATRQADLAKTSVMHAVAHDLRIPLAGLTEVASTVGDDRLSDEDRARVASALRQDTAHLARMVDDLLDLSRIEAGATNPHPEWCDLAEVVATAVERVSSQRADCAVNLNLAPDLPLVQADRGQLERVFSNLIENAAKFSPAGRSVEVRGLCANGRVTIRVIDHGRGIAPAQQSQVFRAFVRGSGPESGSGLGLAICRGFVEANGGRITLQSGARDGSAFAVSFPTTKQPSPVR
jgi:K+-sensing histidine kinase KdpD